eukprot:TRINITY_DN5470_c0_g1_i1.p1 TRINITY_DN5470_c0_g1~~TRINITY_DN5470_c0_g1_i1.p1  ORF type:complete len:279 (-),score=48.27 TRINITY_DN5470_c0_g1_i1:70-867(-)
MCIVFLALGHHPKHKVVMLVNRDEEFSRPTVPMRYWEDEGLQGILGGRDMKTPWPSTQFAVTKTGRFVVITNYRSATPLLLKSRGALAVEFLVSTLSPEKFLLNLIPTLNEYDGFNIICGTPDDVYYMGNRMENPKPVQLQQGEVYGLSNALLDTDWHKVTRGKNLLRDAPDLKIDTLYEILSDQTLAPPGGLQVTEAPVEVEEHMQTIFVPPHPIREYLWGTRCQHVLLVDDDNQVTVTENFRKSDGSWVKSEFSFVIEEPLNG